jgi:cold shock CspA family protein
MSKNFHRGYVESFNQRAGYGYVVPDESTDENQRLLIHSKSLRHQATLIEAGDRVVYRIESVPRGLLAADVVLESEDDVVSSDIERVEEAVGTISKIRTERGFGYIEYANQEVFFKLGEALFAPTEKHVGSKVTFQLSHKGRGLEAHAVSLNKAGPPQSIAVPNKIVGGAKDILAKAIIARDSKDFAEAVRLYQRGMSQNPSVQLITSYAAMEKNRNHRKEAIAIYEAGIALYPTNPKLLEDAGILAASIGNRRKALEFLERGLDLSRDSERSERVFLLAIARIYASRPTLEDLGKALDFYGRARLAFESSPYGKGTFPKEDQLAMNLAAIRLQHHRGNLVYEFIRRAGFKIVRAHLLDQVTVGADIVVEVKSLELVESYGISGNLLIRCMFKSDLQLSDIQHIERTTSDLGTAGLIDDQVSILLVASLPESVEKLLYGRIEDKRRATPAIVPLTQSQIETAEDALSALRFVLDRWLHRRDLFAQNFPVSGRRFFGRHRSMAEVKDAIATGTAAGIFGLRKVGKTSLLKEIQRRASENGDIVVYIDLLRVPADITDTRWLYWKIAFELHGRLLDTGIKAANWRLGGQFVDFLDIPADYPVATAFDSDLTQALRVVRSINVTPRPHIVLMLDEIERVLPTALGKEGFSGFFDFFSYLRGVAQESNDFVLIVTGANASIAEASQFAGRDNPVFNFFKEIYLPMLQLEETAQMVRTLGRGMGMHFSPRACDYVHQLGGGHPFFSRQFCSFLSDRFTDRPVQVTPEMIESVVDQYLEVASKDFQEIVDRFSRDYPAELDACIAIASATAGADLDQLSQSGRGSGGLKHLIGYQLVELRGRKASLSMDLMRRWLNRTSSAKGAM